MKNKWVVIDCQYQFPKFAAAFLRVKNGKAVFIENNTNKAIPHLLQALDNQGVRDKDVNYLIVTHAHLDHAGATAALAKRFSEAVVLAHPKAAKTLAEPERLIVSAKKVYGEEKFRALYGEIEPVPKNRIYEIQEGETLNWEGVPFQFFYTEGHASHHFCILDESSQSVFTGDAFGLSYPALSGKRPFHVPSTSPVDFDYESALKALNLIEATQAKTAYLTHFGPVEEIPERAALLRRHLRAHQELVEAQEQAKTPDTDLGPKLLKELSSYFDRELEACGISITSSVRELLKMDLELNAAGLAVSCQRKRKKSL